MDVSGGDGVEVILLYLKKSRSDGMENDAIAFSLLKKHGFWMRRNEWLDENYHDRFYRERKDFLMLLVKMTLVLLDFEQRTYELQHHQIDGKGHEEQAEKVSQQYMKEYEKIRKAYAKLLPVMIAILTPQNAKFEIKIHEPKNSR